MSERIRAANIETDYANLHLHLGELVLGVTDLSNVPEALMQAHATLAGTPMESYEAYAAEEQRLRQYEGTKSYEIPVDDFERHVTLWTLRQIFEGRQMLRHNVLRSWPFYEHLYNVHVAPRDQAVAAEDNARDALLVGSMTSLSARAFAQLATHVYGSQNAHVVDIHGGADKVRHGRFVYGDARTMPYRDNSMHIVQTNHLFDQIGEHGWHSKREAKEADSQAVMREMFRVVRPGGHLLLIESPIGFDYADNPDSEYNHERTEALTHMLSVELPEAGFTDLAIKTAFTLKGVQWLFDRERAFDNYEREEVASIFGVYARKPE